MRRQPFAGLFVRRQGETHTSNGDSRHLQAARRMSWGSGTIAAVYCGGIRADSYNRPAADHVPNLKLSQIVEPTPIRQLHLPRNSLP